MHTVSKRARMAVDQKLQFRTTRILQHGRLHIPHKLWWRLLPLLGMHKSTLPWRKMGVLSMRHCRFERSRTSFRQAGLVSQPGETLCHFSFWKLHGPSLLVNTENFYNTFFLQNMVPWQSLSWNGSFLQTLFYGHGHFKMVINTIARGNLALSLLLQCVLSGGYSNDSEWTT